MIRILFFLFLFSFTVSAQNFSIFFSTDKSAVSPKYYARIDSAVAVSKSKTLPVNIACHCDNRADSTYNYQLSLQRAESVKKVLKAKGVRASISIIGYGESNPEFPNTPQMRFKNRRCDVQVGDVPFMKTDNFTEVDIKKLLPGDLLQLDGLEFVGNQALPNYYSMPVLYQLFDVMRTHPDLKIKLKGHVCCSDDMSLSEARAFAVFNFLKDNGIDSNRLTYQGYSNYIPLVKEISSETQQRNRRVEVLITANSELEIALEVRSVPLKFIVPLRDMRFKPNSDYPLGITQHNLGFLSEMIKESSGYQYVLYVFASSQPLVARRRNYLESYFRRDRITKIQMVFIPRGKFDGRTEDMLILEVKPLSK